MSSSKRPPRAGPALLLAAGVLAFAFFAYRAWVMFDADFVAYYNAGGRTLWRINPYAQEQTPFKYFPLTAFLFVPFALLPIHAAKGVFFALCFAAGAWVYARVHRFHGTRITALTLLIMMPFHNHDFLNAQVNHLLLALFVAFVNLRRRSPRQAAAVAALFASFKLTPILLFAPLAPLLRRRKEFWLTGVFFAVGNLLAALFYPEGLGIYRSWLDVAAPGGAGTPTGAGPLLALAIKGGLMAGALLKARRAQDESERDYALSLGLVASLLFTPLYWKHNFVLCLPAVAWGLAQGRSIAVGAFFLIADAIPFLRSAACDFCGQGSDITVVAATAFVALSLWHPERHFARRLPKGSKTLRI